MDGEADGLPHDVNRWLESEMSRRDRREGSSRPEMVTAEGGGPSGRGWGVRGAYIRVVLRGFERC